MSFIKKLSPKALGVSLVLLCAALWSFSGVCGQYIFVTRAFSPNYIVPIRLTVSGVVLVVYSAIRLKGKIFGIFRSLRDTVELLVLGILGIGMCQYTYYAAIANTNAGTATVLQYICPCFVSVYIWMRARRAPKLSELAAVFLAVAGTFLLATHGSFSSLAISPKGLFYGIASALCLSVYNIEPRRLLSRHDTILTVGWGMLAGGAVMTVAISPWKYAEPLNPTDVGMLSVIIFFGTVLTFSIYLIGTRLIGPANASLICCAEPLGIAVLTALIFSVPFTVYDIIGFACIISTVLVLTLEKKTPEPAGK